MTSVREARTALADASARRGVAESAVETIWRDAARRTFCARILQPLESETSHVDAAMRALDEDLARALILLADGGAR